MAILDRFRLPGRSGLRVSPLSLGTMTFGTEWGRDADKNECRRIFDAAVEAGGTFIPEEMVRPRVRVVIVCAAVLALAAPGSRRAATPAPPPGDPSRFIDSLFFAARYDTILQILPGMLRGAQASYDSVLIGRLVAQEGRVHLAQGRPNEAERLIDVALRISESVRDTINWMPTLNYKGFVLVGQGRYGDAIPYYEKRLELARRVKSAGDEAWAWSSIAYVHSMQNDLVRARDEYLLAIRLFREVDRPRQELTPLLGLGQVLGLLGDVDGRRECYQRVWLVARETGDPVSEMWAVNNLGHLEFGSGDMGKALAYYQRAFEMGRETGSARGKIQPAINYAQASAYVGRFALAESVLVEARRVYETSGNTEFQDEVESAIAWVRIGMGEYRAAATLCRELLRRPAEVAHRRDDMVLNLATALANMDSLTEAVAVLTDHFDTPGMTFDPEDLPDVNLLLAEAYCRMDDPASGLARALAGRRAAEAVGLKREATRARFIESSCRRRLGDGAGAVAALQTALDSLSAMREGVGAPEWREAFGARIVGSVIDAARVALEYPDSVSSADRERAFFDVVQRVKARTLIERITEPRFGTGQVVDRVASSPLSIGDLQSSVLQEGELFLDFVAGEEESFLFAVTDHDLQVVTLPGSRSTLSQRVMLFREIVSDPSALARREYPPERVEAIARALGDAILGAVSDRLARAHRVFVSPDGFFAAVPFAALVLEGGEAGPRALIERTDIVTVPCAGVLALARSRAGGGGSPGVVAMTGADVRGLPGARQEAGDLARRFRPVEVVTGFEGDAAAFANTAARAGILHIAAHARVNDESPWESGFWLGRAAPADLRGASRRASGSLLLSREDSLEVAQTFSAPPTLHAWQIASVALPNELAVLAGCETAGGRMTTGEAVLGLTAAFLSAGVPVVVSAAWPIDDRATAEFMRSFYGHLSAVVPVAEALRLAQLDLRARREFSHPFYWAGFTVAGDGSRVVAVERAPRAAWTWILAAAVMAAVASALWYRARRHGAPLRRSQKSTVTTDE